MFYSMIENFGIGIDLSNIERFKKKSFETNKDFYKKIFTQKEILYCLKFKNSYDRFAGKFALKESSGKGKGEFYTPKSIVNLIAELIEPYRGIIYDPCCGTGGMFVQSIKFTKQSSQND